MKRTNIYIALCAVALGREIINPGDPLPENISEGKIKSLLSNGSIEKTEVQSAITNTQITSTTGASTIVGDGSGQVLPDASDSIKKAEGIEGATTATLTGAVTKDGRLVELNELSLAALKKLATELGVTGAAQMKKKETLVEAITAIEFNAAE